MQRFQPPRTHEDRAMVLCGLDDETLLVFIEGKARAQDVGWLSTMLDIGLFDAADERQDTHNWLATPYRVHERLTAAMAFLKDTRLAKIAEDPEYGLLETPAYRMHLQFSDEMKAFFVRFSDRLCDQLPILHANHPGNENEDPSSSDGCDDEDFTRLKNVLEKAAAHAIVGTCAFGIPEAAGNLAKIYPTAQGIGLSPDTVGFALSDFLHESSNNGVGLTPRCFAMLFSNRSCMDRLHTAPGDGHDTYVVINATQSNGLDEPCLYSVVDAAGLIFTPVCEPSAFSKALAMQKSSDDPVGEQTWTYRMEQLLEGKDGFKTMAPYLVAYERAGYFELLPTATAEMACKHGHAGILSRLQGELDWEVLAEKKPLEMTSERRHSIDSTILVNKDRYDESMAVFCQRAINDGKNDYILIHTPSERHPVMGAYYVEPLRFLVEGGFNKTLLKMLDAGMSPTEPPFPETLSPLDIAVSHSKSPGFKGGGDTEGLFRAYSARSAAHGLLVDILPAL